MNLENISVGMVVKNYKELCSLLGEKVKSGNAKKYQLIDWDRYFEYKKEGNKFIITNILDNALEKTSKRGGNNVLPFIEEMELLLIDMLVRNPSDTLAISKSKLMLELCMINPNYHKYFGDRDKLSKVLDLDINYIIDFYDTTSSTFKSAIDTVNRRLESKKLIIHETVFMITYTEYEIALEKVNGAIARVRRKLGTVYREATKEEREAILSIEHDIMKNKYEVDNMQELFKKNLVHKYYNDIAKELKDQLGIDKAHKAERYTYLVDELINQKIKILDNYQIKKLEDDLNLKVMVRIDENSNKRYEKAMYDLLEYNKLHHRKPYRVDNEYVDSQNMISSSLIDKYNADSVNDYNTDNRFLDDIMSDN